MVEFCNGKKQGQATFWWDNGQKFREAEYHNDNLVNEKCWDENGTPINCGSMFNL